MFLEKHNFFVIEKEMSSFNEDIETYSDEDIYSYNQDSGEEYSDDFDSSYEKHSDGKREMKKIYF